MSHKLKTENFVYPPLAPTSCSRCSWFQRSVLYTVSQFLYVSVYLYMKMCWKLRTKLQLYNFYGRSSWILGSPIWPYFLKRGTNMHGTIMICPADFRSFSHLCGDLIHKCRDDPALLRQRSTMSTNLGSWSFPGGEKTLLQIGKKAPRKSEMFPKMLECPADLVSVGGLQTSRTKQLSCSKQRRPKAGEHGRLPGRALLRSNPTGNWRWRHWPRCRSILGRDWCSSRPAN